VLLMLSLMKKEPLFSYSNTVAEVKLSLNRIFHIARRLMKAGDPRLVVDYIEEEYGLIYSREIEDDDELYAIYTVTDEKRASIFLFRYCIE